MIVPEDAAPLAVTLFGPMQVCVGGRRLPHLRSRKSLWLLALLLLRHGRPIEREWLAGTLWPDADQDQSLTSLRTVLSELRKALGSEGERLRSPNRHTLSMDLTSADVDVLTFDAAVTGKNLSALERAVALYTGPLLEGCTEEWIGQERTARERDCLTALQTLAEGALAAGDHGVAINHYRRAVGLDPWAEAARRGLMEALAQGGDSNAALQVHREFIELLRDDPKAAPDAQTSALYVRLRGEARRKAAAPPPAPAARREAAPAVAGYLPHPLTELVGREEERLEVAGRLRRARLVTLTGPGGIGKTRLAVAVAGEVVREFADGVWFIALDALSDGGQVPTQIARVLRLKEESGRPLLHSLSDHLRRKRVLLVLDNCEHVLTACAQAAEHLLRECAGTRILATSREALGITGETAWAVQTLAVPDPAHLPAGRATLVRVLAGYEGVQLFVERAQAVQKTFSLTGDNARPLAEVCARLEGLPLAIELAAARIRAMTVAQIAARLENHLGLLMDGSRAAPSRQQTLRATLDWSYSLLTDAERALLGRLSAFAGGWSLEAAEAVCAGPGNDGGEGIGTARVLDLLASLTDKSLVMFEEREVRGRYRLLEMVRQYAAEWRGAGSEPEHVRAQHRDYFLSLAEEAEPQLTGMHQEMWLARLEADHENLRTALAWCRAEKDGAEAGLRLAGALWRFWQLRGHYNEGRTYLSEALAREGAGARTNERAKALNAAGVLASCQGDYGAAGSLHGESLTISREMGNEWGIAWSLNDLGGVASTRGDYRAAGALHEESLAIFRTLGDRQGIGWSIHQLGSMVREQGDYGRARALYEESLAISRELADKQGIAWSLNDLGGVAASQGDLGAARALYEESLAISRELADGQGIAWSLHHLGKVIFDQGDYELAGALHAESLAIFRTMGNRPGIGWSLHQLGNLASLRGDHGTAESLERENLAIQRDLKNRRGIGRSLGTLGGVAFDQGASASAQALYGESLSIQRELGDWRGVASSLDGLAAVLAPQAAGKAARLWGAAQSLRESIGSPLPPREQETYDRQVAKTRAAMGADAFAAAWEEGHILTREQASAYALTEEGVRASE